LVFSLPAERLTHVKVGLASVNPQVQAPAEGNYEVCATVDDVLAAGENKLIKCSGTGRYLVIQLPAEQYLTLCEVEVFGGKIIHW
jgi:hypothetical protein